MYIEIWFESELFVGDLIFKKLELFVCTQLNITIVCTWLNGFKYCFVILTILTVKQF